MIRFMLVAFTIISGQAFAQDFSLFEKKEFAAKGGQVLPYRILYPENYNPDEKYPLVLFLHGGGERGNDNEKQLVNGVKAFLEPENRSEFPCIVIVPQCPADSYWASVKFERTNYPLDLNFDYDYDITEGLKLVIELTKSVMKKEAVDKNRVYITGLSMGGMGTLEAVYRFPKLFAAAVAVCGGADAEAYGKKQAKVPFWLFHGESDSVIAVENSRAMNARLKELGAEVKYTEYPGVDHNSWDNAYADPALFPWLFSKSR